MDRKPEKAQNAEARMDLTPMIDVVFLLIVFFLCLEFKTLEGRLAANLPRDIGSNRMPAEPIEKLDIRISTLDRGTRIVDPMDSRRYELVNHSCQWQVGASITRSPSALEQLLARESRVEVTDRAGKPKLRPVTIKTGPGVTYGDVTAVIDIARNAGFREITFSPGN